MKFYDIEKLKRDKRQDDLYNLFEITFRFQDNPSVPLRTYILGEEQTMRPDLISQNLYSDTDYIDSLCNVNSIDNPLNFMTDDAIIYPSRGALDTYKTDDIYIETTPGIALNAEKTTQVDNNRKDYVEKNYNLTPTAKEVPRDPIKIKGSTIVIGENT